jgi:hypothetical protein
MKFRQSNQDTLYNLCRKIGEMDMGYKGLDKEYQLNVIVDRIIGEECDTFKYGKTKFSYNAIIDEDTIEELSKQLEDMYPEYVNKKLWFPLTFYVDDYTRGSLRYIVDEIVDDDNLMRIIGNYFYSGSDRQEIVHRCAEVIKKRLRKYAGRYRIQYKVFENGNVGFRYE